MTQIIYLFIMLIGTLEMMLLDEWIGLALLLVGGFLLIATEIQEKEL